MNSDNLEAQKVDQILKKLIMQQAGVKIYCRVWVKKDLKNSGQRKRNIQIL